MKTHDIAKSLSMLAKLLRSSPNVELSDFTLTAQKSDIHNISQDMPTTLVLLAALSKYTKSDWIKVIVEYNLNIEIKKTDSTRDIIGRFMKYMSENPKAVKEFKTRAESKTLKVSKELSDALSILLR